MNLSMPKLIFRGGGTVKRRPLSDDEFLAIKARAETISNQQIRDDLFRLIVEVEVLRSERMS